MSSVAQGMTATIYCTFAETLSGWILCLVVLPKLKDTEPKEVFYMKVVENYVSFLTV